MPDGGRQDHLRRSSGMIHILVTGSRHAEYREWADIVRDAILEHAKGEPYWLIHGDAKGIDRIAGVVGMATSPIDSKAYQITSFTADWHSFGKAAGPRRNQQMLDFVLARMAEGHAAVCLAFHNDLDNSKGTNDMVRRAKQAGIPVAVYDGKGTR